MTYHLIDNSEDELQIILKRIYKENKHLVISYNFNSGKIISLESDDIELMNYAKKNNPNLKEE
jgi:thymidylate synthase